MKIIAFWQIKRKITVVVHGLHGFEVVPLITRVFVLDRLVFS